MVRRLALFIFALAVLAWSNLLDPHGAAASGGAIKGYLRVDPTSGGPPGGTGVTNAVAEIDDLDGDGVKELAIGAPYDDGTGGAEARQGAVWIAFMDASGAIKSNPPAQRILLPGAQNGVQFGNRLAWLGDLDAGPGVTRALAVGVPGVGTTILGEVRILFLGYSGGSVSVSSYQDVNLPHARCLPSALASLGDFDADGIPDLAVGNGCEGSNQGTVYVVRLNSDGTQKSITQIGPSGISPALDSIDEFGSSLAWLGSLGAMPRVLAVGAANDEAQGSDTGVVYLLNLNADGTMASQQKIGNGSAGLAPGTLIDNGQFGAALAPIGDLDGDGVPDLAVGNPATGHGNPPSTGSVVNLFLNGDGSVKDLQRIIADSDASPMGGDGCLPCVLLPQDYFGVALSSISDRNGDGVRDLAVGVIGFWQGNGLFELFLSNGPVQHPAVCQQSCGDKLVAGSEACDDGNTIGGDGCSATCGVEPGYSCDGCFHGPSVCVTSCGDGVTAGAEQCDDGARVGGDGCSASCTVEDGYVCSGQPSVCTPICGDGMMLSPEQCDDGNTASGDCCSPTCVFEAPTTECRPASGACDLAESCTGASGSCPADAVAPAGTACADDSNPCTVDRCDGVATDCTHVAGNAGTPCRNSAGVCDVAETCTGTSAACPPDSFAPATTECRTASDVCDLAEHCSGTSAGCPSDGFAPSTTVCRPPSGACDQPELCTGLSATCPPDVGNPASCGDGIVQPECEQCDLGPQNGAPDSRCTADCQVTGICPTTGVGCTSAADCPPGDGCCGNTVVEPGEQCDDGNDSDGDCCSTTCQTEPAVSCAPSLCAELGIYGPHVLSASEKLRLNDAKSDGSMEKWSKSGDFNLFSGQSVDPDSETVIVAISENNGTNQRAELHRAVLVPGGCAPAATCFRANSAGTSWRFKDNRLLPDPAQACGFESATFRKPKGNKVKFQLKGKADAGDDCVYSFPRPTGTIVREDIVIGNECATVLLDCRVFGGNRAYQCTPRP